MEVDVILTALLILLGACIMTFSVMRTRTILPLVQDSSYQWSWRLLFVLMLFFGLGYLTAFVLVLRNFTDSLVALTGIIFFLGALFVFIVVRTGFLTIRELNLTQKSVVFARDEAIVASQLKSELLARVSHELRTPLHAILGYAEILDKGVHGPLTDIQRRSIGRISCNADQLVGQINNLLRQSQIEVGDLPIQMEPMALVDLLESVRLVIGPPANEKGLALRCSIEDDVPAQLLADPQRLMDILTPLVDNAVKFTEAGEIGLRIFRPNSGYYAIEVKDTGIGIPDEALAVIFDPFRQVDGSSRRSFGGSGLGLAIAKQTAVLMGGELHVQSKEGRGSCFTVLLPLVLYDAVSV
jgi:signal transduction histidine kinase